MADASPDQGRCECNCGRARCASRRRRDLGILVHGIAATYSEGCRCLECTRASTAKTLVQRKRRNGSTRERAVRNGQQWTGPELEIALRSDLSAAEAALMLGRTMQAVKNVRFKCRHEPRFTRLAGVSP